MSHLLEYVARGLTVAQLFEIFSGKYHVIMYDAINRYHVIMYDAVNKYHVIMCDTVNSDHV